jgi:UDP-N-acetyl-D-glucosamine dehydrogenase
VSYHDPLVRSLAADEHLALLSVPRPRAEDYDLALMVTVHDGHDYAWLDAFEHVLDCTYNTPLGRERALI